MENDLEHLFEVSITCGVSDTQQPNKDARSSTSQTQKPYGAYSTRKQGLLIPRAAVSRDGRSGRTTAVGPRGRRRHSCRSVGYREGEIAACHPRKAPCRYYPDEASCGNSSVRQTAQYRRARQQRGKVRRDYMSAGFNYRNREQTHVGEKNVHGTANRIQTH